MMNQLRKKYHTQCGISLMSFMLWLIILGIGGVYASQIGLVYLKKKTIKETVNQVFSEVKSREVMPTTREIQSSILKRFEINNIDIKSENIVITKTSDSGYKANIDWVKEIKISDTMTLLIDASVQETSSGKK